MLKENCEGEICNYSSKHEFRFLGLWLSELEEFLVEVSKFSRFQQRPEIKVAGGKDSLGVWNAQGYLNTSKATLKGQLELTTYK